MFILQGPYPTLVRTVVLPSPELLDTKTLPISVNWKQAIDGTNYTYSVLNRTVERLFTYNFDNVQYDKMTEMFEFYTLCSISEIRITDQKSLQYRVRMIMPELTVSILRRSVVSCPNDFQEAGSFVLTFRGYEL